MNNDNVFLYLEKEIDKNLTFEQLKDNLNEDENIRQQDVIFKAGINRRRFKTKRNDVSLKRGM